MLLHLLDCPPGDWRAPCPRRGGSHRPPPRRCPCSRGSAARSGGSRGRAGIPAHTKGSPTVQKRTQRRRGKRIPTSIHKVLQLMPASLYIHIQIVRFVNLLFPGCGKVWW